MPRVRRGGANGCALSFDFASLVVFTCTASCTTAEAHVREYVWVQPPASAEDEDAPDLLAGLLMRAGGSATAPRVVDYAAWWV